MQGPSTSLRAEARYLFEHGATLSAVSRATGIDRKTLRGMREREGWIPQALPQVGNAEIQQMREQTRRNVVEQSTEEALSLVRSRGFIESQADELAEMIASQQRIANLMLQCAEKTLIDAMSGKIKPRRGQNAADTLLVIMGAVGTAITTSREIAGLLPGQPSVAPQQPSASITLQQRRVEAVPVASNVSPIFKRAA